MRLRRALFGCLRWLAVLALIAGTWLPSASPAQAAPSLEAPYDHLSSTAPLQELVQHEIGFILPSSLTAIQTSDWILITLPGFTNLTGFTDFVGGFGTPIFDVDGNTLRATHLSVLPGTSLALIGATATNPPTGGNYNVTINIAKGRSDGPIGATATVVAGTTNSYNVVSAIVDSPLSALIVSGFTSPLAFVSLTENGSVIGTTKALNDGSFSFSVNGLIPGDHTLSIQSTDGNNLSSSPSPLQVHLLPSTVTTASGLLLSSTIELNKSAINQGDTLTMTGTSKPNSQINVFTESPLRSYTANSDAQGDWSYTLVGTDTQTYSPGQYRAYTVVQDGAGNQSLNSPTNNFTVISPTSGANPPPACDISHGDLNCDHKTNLTDFSILLFHWGTNHHVADINNDSKVNLTDFSIMMFYFQF